MKRLILILAVLALLFGVTGCQDQGSVQVNGTAAIAPLTMEEKINDFESLYKILKENYPFFEVNKRVNGVDWLSNKEKYMNMINLATTERQYKDTLEKILMDLNNGHTNIINEDFYNFAKAAYGAHGGESDVWLEQLNKPRSLLRYSNNKGAQKKSATSSQQTNAYIKPDNINTRIIADKKVAYLSIASLNSFNIEGDMKIIKPFLEKVKDYSALIIDIRGNGGGDSNYWQNNLVPMLINKPVSWKTYYVYRGGESSEPFVKARLTEIEIKPISEISKENLAEAPPEIMEEFKYFKEFETVIEPKNPIGFIGKIYLLVDRKVYSSSEMFASFAKNTGFATLVGETSGGDGIGQDPMMYSLPNSGYIVRFPLVMGLTADGSCNEEHKTVPDIQVAAEKTKDITKDAAIQYVLGLY